MRMNYASTFFLTVLVVTAPLVAQVPDSTKIVQGKEITVKATKLENDSTWLGPVHGTYIVSGKKSEVIHLSDVDAPITEKYARKIFSKIPGLFVYDMDGTGNQVNISTRGLDAHRGWEFNIRKDGILTTSDMYGYPASHYNVPMEAVDRIELIRGTGSLQYGAQFGGMLNYISKPIDTSRAMSFESINTVGSYGLLSTFNSVDGKIGTFKYYAWFNKKASEGYRANGDSKYDAEDVTVYYEPNDDLSIKAEWTRSNYLIHLAGPLTDSMFAADPEMSTRSRNYYDPEINITSLSFDWAPSTNTHLRLTTGALLGVRSSVLFDKPANIADTIDATTLQYANREVGIDHFNSYTTELRLLQSYDLLGHVSSVVVGAQYMNNDLHRQQLGKGTTGTDYDLSLATPGWGRDMHYKTQNIALFLENRLALLGNFSINAGARVEIGTTDMTGTTTYYPDSAFPNTIDHRFPLFGVNMQYTLPGNIDLYAGWAQAYRPVVFKDIVPGSIYEVADKNLKDAYGYNLEVGCRGTWEFLRWDLTGFRLQYDNRIGTLAQTDSAGDLIVFRTNIGNSVTQGVECFAQARFLLGEQTELSLFTATSYMDARYRDAVVRSGEVNVNIDGNHVESVPEWISRDGATLKYSSVSLSILTSYTSESYADPLNTETPTVNGTVGLVPAYQIWDVSSTIYVSKQLEIKLNASNIFDKQYFTKRPQFYPGPGIWPSDGRSLSATLLFKV